MSGSVPAAPWLSVCNTCTLTWQSGNALVSLFLCFIFKMSFFWKCWLTSHKIGHDLLHALLQSWVLCVRDHVPLVGKTCSQLGYQGVICLQFNNLTFNCSRVFFILASSSLLICVCRSTSFLTITLLVFLVRSSGRLLISVAFFDRAWLLHTGPFYMFIAR